MKPIRTAITVMSYPSTSNSRGHITAEDTAAVCAKHACGCNNPEPDPGPPPS